MTTVTSSVGFLLLFTEDTVTPDDIDGDSIIYFGKYGVPQAYFPTDYWAQTISLNTPTCRTLTIESESRTLSVEGEGTGSAVSTTPVGFLLLFTNVTASGTPTERTLTIEADDRTLSIESCTDGG